MAWIVFIVIICVQLALCQYNPRDSYPEGSGFGQNNNWSPRGGFSNFYATTPPLPKMTFNSNAESARPSDLYDLENKITRAGKWPEFIAKVKETGDKVKGSVMPNWEEDVFKWAEWAKNLDSPSRREPAPRRPPLVRIEESDEKPSLGMEMYWGKDNGNGLAPPSPQRSRPEHVQTGYEGPGPRDMSPGAPGYNSPQTQGYVPPPPNRGMPKQISPDDMMTMAQKRIEFLEKQQQYGLPNLDGIPPAAGLENERQNPFGEQLTKSTNTEKKPSEGDLIKFAFSKLHQIETMLRTRESEINGTNSTTNNEDQFSKLPKVDDFNSPIRWVPFNSDDTADGIAKVTDKESSKNTQYTINGTIYVPVVDYDITRLGLTTEPTTVSSAILAMYRASTEVSVLRTVVDNVDMKQPDQKDWLAFETILGGDRSELMCRKLGCQTTCDGDTCAAGCVGPACSSMCKGAGCSSMCIGEGCIARCKCRGHIEMLENFMKWSHFMKGHRLIQYGRCPKVPAVPHLKCDGLSCDARCRGKKCEADCRKPSCYFTINGKAEASRANWNDYYAQQVGSPDGNYD